MSKKHFIALADAIRDHNALPIVTKFTPDQIEALADFCDSQNSAFDRNRWLNYIEDKDGPSGGKR